MAKYSAMDIARWFIAHNIIFAEPLSGEYMTRMRVMKLLYYAEGCSLALDNGSLFSEDIVAWENGPCVEEVYKHYENDVYNLPFGDADDLASLQKIEKSDKDILIQVFEVFGQYATWYLRNRTKG